MKKVLSIFAFLTVTVATGVAYAQDALPLPDADLGGFFLFLYEKMKSGQGMMVFGGALVLGVYLVRKLLASQMAWFKTKLGGYVTALFTSLGLTVGVSLMAGQGLEMSLLMTAVSASFMAAGGWESLRDLLIYLTGSKKEE